jgi:hypothetical protein
MSIGETHDLVDDLVTREVTNAQGAVMPPIAAAFRGQCFLKLHDIRFADLLGYYSVNISCGDVAQRFVEQWLLHNSNLNSR